jgi:hypothetical protein
MKQKEYDDTIAQLQDRTSDIRSIGQSLVDAWGFDLDSRKPGLAYVDEDGSHVTNLDMACALAKLVEWEPIIVVPWYKAEGPATVTEGQALVSKENRHGKLIGLVSNQHRLKFSMRFIDYNVMTSKEVGMPRTFSLFDDGEWYEGFESFTFKPTEEESQVLAKFAGGSNTVAFDTFIHTSRWPSFYGRPYRLAMYTIQRIADQIKWLKGQLKIMEAKLNIEPEPFPKSERVGEQVSKKVWKFNVETAPLSFEGDYPDLPVTEDSYVSASRLKKRLNKIIEILRFQTRATDYAIWHYIKDRVGEDKLLDWIKTEEREDDGVIPVAGWIKDSAWKVGYQEPPRKKNKKYWCRLDLPHGEFLQFHINQMTVQVSK